MTILVLGGTGDAREIAIQLHATSHPIIYSVAGLVLIPKAKYPIISGGFSQFGGLKAYIQKNKIALVVDATHPYAVNITATAQQTTRTLGLPYLRYERPVWRKCEGDCWLHFEALNDLLNALEECRKIFLSVGQVTPDLLAKLTHAELIILRTMEKPDIKLPGNVVWVEGMGPFHERDEQALFQQYQPDALVTKNSGGTATAAKLAVARQLEIPVYMLDRPHFNQLCETYTKSNDVIKAATYYYSSIYA